MSRFLIVGPATVALRNYLEEHGHEHVRLIDKTQTKMPEKVIKHQVVTDFSDDNVYLRDATVTNQQSPINGVLTTYENSVLAAAKIAQKLGLPGLSTSAAEACTDKFLMRQLFAKSPDSISPDFAMVSNQDELLEFATKHQYPLILKPANLAKSLLVTKNTSQSELIANYQRTMEQIDDIYHRYAPHRKPKVIVEEFMEGSIHSVDAFVDSSGGVHVLDCIVDYQTGYDIGHDDNFHYSRILPSSLPTSTQDKVKKVAKLGCNALGICSSPVHIEVIITPQGPKIVEIGARNGGYRERMHGIANGIDIINASLETALGKTPTIAKQRNDYCAVLEIFPKKNGLYSAINHESEVRNLNSFVQMNIKVTPGSKVGKAADGYKMCAMILLHSTNKDQFLHDLNYVTEQVTVQLI
jgi:biotin carboxylase